MSEINDDSLDAAHTNSSAMHVKWIFSDVGPKFLQKHDASCLCLFVQSDIIECFKTT